MDELTHRLNAWMQGENAGPMIAQLHLTNRCNLRCVFCPTRTFMTSEDVDRQKELSREDWLDLIDQGEAMDIEEWHICGGGEPLFFTETAYDVMKKIKSLGRHGEIITNGTLFDERFAKMLCENKWDKITFSIDAPDPETYNKIRGVNLLPKVIENLKLFKRYRQRGGPRIAVHFVVCDLNFRLIPLMIKFCKNHGIDEFLLNALNEWSEDIKIFALGKDEKKELGPILKDALKLCNKHGIDTNISSFIDEDFVDHANHMADAMKEQSKNTGSLTEVPCFSPWYNISIFSDGRILPCFILKDKGVSIKDRSLSEIWSGTYFESVRKSMLEGNLSKDCMMCNPWSLGKTKEIRKKLLFELF